MLLFLRTSMEAVLQVVSALVLRAQAAWWAPSGVASSRTASLGSASSADRCAASPLLLLPDPVDTRRTESAGRESASAAAAATAPACAKRPVPAAQLRALACHSKNLRQLHSHQGPAHPPSSGMLHSVSASAAHSWHLPPCVSVTQAHLRRPAARLRSQSHGQCEQRCLSVAVRLPQPHLAGTQ